MKVSYGNNVRNRFRDTRCELERLSHRCSFQGLMACQAIAQGSRRAATVLSPKVHRIDCHKVGLRVQDMRETGQRKPDIASSDGLSCTT